MNNKGFTLIEVLATIIIISLLLFVVTKEIGNTLSITKNESYNLMKNNISKSAKNYIDECNNNIMKCKLNWNDNKVSFKAKLLKSSGYFSDLKSPIDGKDLSECLIINATRENGVTTIFLKDTCY